ncbi:hypothetical protein ACTIVE_3384 [Actinomadura verrucosospora]|uniref:Uncharacterized protein n=2 Tax=Actinomadura verrucosospora TaxID=46165 RepID=A0A7D3ZX76_ACTVE|nr:hypothetical protein ACTIVE_3384 [Actinomadura verrucosospora]
MSEALDAIAETIENDLHGKLIDLARWLVMTLATAPESGTGIGLVATVGLLLEFLQRLYELNGAYRQALKPAQDKMENVYGKSIGVQQLTGLDLGLPTKIPFVTPSISPLLPNDIIGDWDNWEHKKPAQRNDGQFAPPPTIKPDSGLDKSPFDNTPGGEALKKLLRGG